MNDIERMPEILEDIPALDHPVDLERFKREFLVARRPVVIRTGGLERLDWRTSRWTPDYLVERVGRRPVSVQVRQGGAFGAARSAKAYQEMPFDEFVRRVVDESGGEDSLYLNLQKNDLQLTPPLLQLLGDFTLPVYFRDLAVRWINLWMGRSSGQARSQLHHDFHDNLYCVVRGRKTFVVFPPDDAPNLYTHGKVARVEPNGVIHYQQGGAPSHLHFTMLDTADVDLQRFPLYARTHPRRVTIEAGDLFYMPAGWFHEVRSEGQHVAVNFWADPPPSEMVVRAAGQAAGPGGG